MAVRAGRRAWGYRRDVLYVVRLRVGRRVRIGHRIRPRRQLHVGLLCWHRETVFRRLCCRKAHGSLRILRRRQIRGRRSLCMRLPGGLGEAMLGEGRSRERHRHLRKGSRGLRMPCWHMRIGPGERRGIGHAVGSRVRVCGMWVERVGRMGRCSEGRLVKFGVTRGISRLPGTRERGCT